MTPPPIIPMVARCPWCARRYDLRRSGDLYRWQYRHTCPDPAEAHR